MGPVVRPSTPRRVGVSTVPGVDAADGWDQVSDGGLHIDRVEIGLGAWQVWRAIALWCVFWLLVRVILQEPSGGLVSVLWFFVYFGGLAGLVWRGIQVLRWREARQPYLPRL